MSDLIVTPDNDDPNDGGSEEGITPDTGFKPITSQEDFNAATAKRVARERKKYEGFDDYKAKAEKFDQYEAEQGSEIEKLTRRAEKAERERDEAKASVAKGVRLDLIRDVAEELGLPKKLVSRVQGETEEDIRADIADLMDGLPAPKKDADPDKDKRKDAPPSQQPKQKMTFTATGDESDSGLSLSADDILKDVPRAGGR